VDGRSIAANTASSTTILYMALLAEKGIVSLDQRKLCSPKSLDFIKSHILSPDGNILLAASESNFLTSWSLNPEVTRSHQYYNPIVGADRTELNYLNLNRVFNIGESVYDLSWYPFMSEVSPESCCFLTTSRDHPIHLWDLNTGYRPLNVLS
jgi:WD40 repeat protein